MMRATEFEFRQRFWFIGGIFWLGFSCYSFDHENAAAALAKLLWGRNFNLEFPADAHGLRLIFAFAAVLSILAAVLRTWAAAYLRSTIVHDHALHSEGLVADGPFRWMRNPLYVGGVLLAAGMGFLASRLGWFVMTFGLMIFYYRLVLREEATLSASQGESFRAYRAAVPRFFSGVAPAREIERRAAALGPGLRRRNFHVGLRRLRRGFCVHPENYGFLHCSGREPRRIHALLDYSPPHSQPRTACTDYVSTQR